MSRVCRPEIIRMESCVDRPWPRSWFRVGCIFLMALLLVGCPQSRGRKTLEGTVTFDGQLIPEGYITFAPQPGTASPSAGGEIRDGRFSVSARQGTFAGTFRVEITAMRKTGKKIKRPPLNEIVDEFEQYLPARYNEQSELTAEIDSSNGDLDFNLESNLRQ